jgi:hypothetical protein
MSHRRWRQIVAPGVSPGPSAVKNDKPSKRATETSAAPTGLWDLQGNAFPGLTPGATIMPPANAGSSSGIPADSSNLTFFSQFQTLVSIILAH